MIATTPQIHEGKTYDRYSLNLAISGRYNPDGTPDASIAMRLIPTTLADGTVETLDAAAQGISLGSLSGTDAPTQAAVAAVQAALQAYLQAKGL